jgi:hypothetical protein
MSGGHEAENSMSGRPRIHGSGDDQEDLGHFKLNLSDNQLNQIADILGVERGSPFEQTLLSGQGSVEPADGQQLLLTYKGRYVRIKYKSGEPEVIPPGTPSDN